MKAIFKIVGTLFTKIMPKCQFTKYSNFLEDLFFDTFKFETP